MEKQTDIEAEHEAKDKSKAAAKDPSHPSNRKWAITGLVFLCFVASFLGSWAFLRTGLVKPDASQTITENRDKIVLQEGQLVAEVAKKVGPSAVSITTEAVNTSLRGQIVTQSAGSGIIISKDGYVLTNKHVISANAADVVVTLSDGTEYDDVKIIARDPSNDLAFLKIEGVNNLPVAQMGNSADMQVGEKVVAIGNALGEFQNTVTSGIISGIGRPLIAGSEEDNTSESLENLFQTDAAINPGNSGGPLVNLKGEVIGINTAIAEQAEGIGFAIPVDQAKGLIKSVLSTGKLVKPYLGVRYISLNPKNAAELGVTQKRGALILGDNGQSGIVAASPAEKASLKNRDIITKVNGALINERNTLASLLAIYLPGDEVELSVIREGKEQTVKVKLEELKT